MSAWRKFLLLEGIGVLATAVVALVAPFVLVAVIAVGDGMSASMPAWQEILEIARFTAIITAAVAGVVVVAYGIPTYFVLTSRHADGLLMVIVAGAFPGALLAFEMVVLSLYAMACGVAIALVVHVCWRKIVHRRFGYTAAHAAEAPVDR
jgi:hypothetical protein